MTDDEGPADRHRRTAARFTETVEATPDWDVPAPVEGWTAREVVRHLTDWFPAFLAGSGGPELERGPGVDTDPVATWRVHTAAVQRALDDPDTAARALDNPHLGPMSLAAAVDMIYTADVFMHTWDLARATGQDDRLDPAFCAVLLGGMTAMEDVIRSSGQYGPAFPVPADADPQTRMLGFIGRDPAWRPAPSLR